MQVTRLLASGRFLYALGKGRVRCPMSWGHEISVVDKKCDSCPIPNTEPINSESWPSAIGKDKAFLAWDGDSMARYAVSEGTQFVVGQFYRLGGRLEDMLLYENYLVVLLTSRRIVVFATGTPGSLRKVNECPIEDWRHGGGGGLWPNVWPSSHPTGVWPLEIGAYLT